MRSAAVLSSAVAVFGMSILGATSCAAGTRLDEIRLPPNFRIAAYAEVPNARSMTLGEKGTLFVGTRKGEVYAVLPGGTAEGPHRTVTVARGLHSPNGVAFHAGALYVAEIGRILRYDGIEGRLSDPPKPVIVNDGFPKDEHHGWKFIRFGPDGMLYIPVGAPCNVCERSDPRYAAILRMKPDGTGLEVFASGVRNTVGFDWMPETKELWFTDNGRDRMGDDLPPDELNRAPRKGLHFGFPYVHGKDVPDPDFGGRGKPPGFTPGVGAPRPLGVAGDEVLHGVDVPSRVPEAGLHRRARVVEPLGTGRVPGHRRASERRTGAALRSVRGRMVAGAGGVGPPRGRPGDARRLPPRIRRQGRDDLPHLLREEVKVPKR